MPEPSTIPAAALARRLAAGLLFVPTLAWNFLLARVLRVRHWWDEVEPHVWMGALPFWFDVTTLLRLGIGAVVNTCAEYAGPRRSYDKAGIEQLRIPTIDFSPPTLAHVEKGVAFMREQVARGRSVYVHCKAGRARSGTVVLCYLVATKRMTPEQAQQQILRHRPHAHRRLAQQSVVREFWQKYRQ